MRDFQSVSLSGVLDMPYDTPTVTGCGTPLIRWSNTPYSTATHLCGEAVCVGKAEKRIVCHNCSGGLLALRPIVRPATVHKRTFDIIPYKLQGGGCEQA